MVGCADKRAPVLQCERDTFALTLNHHLGLPRPAQFAICGGSEQRGAAEARQLLNGPGGTVGKQYWRAFSKAGGAAIAHQMEAQSIEIGQQVGVAQVVDDGAGTGGDRKSVV